MSVENFMKTSFTPYTLSAESTFPYEDKWTAGTAFNAAIDVIEGDEKLFDNENIARVTHIIIAPYTMTTTLTTASKLVSGTHTYLIKNIDDVTLKASHHKEILVEEIL